MNSHLRQEDFGPTGNQPPILLQPDQVAQVLGVSLKTVHKLVREGKLACVQVTGRDRQCIYENCAGYPRSFQEPGRGNGESARAGESNSIWEAPGYE